MVPGAAFVQGLMRAWLGWGAGLAAAVLSAELAKDQGLRTSNWETWPLSLDQQQYAALDAYASLLLYQVPPLDAFHPILYLFRTPFCPPHLIIPGHYRKKFSLVRFYCI